MGHRNFAFVLLALGLLATAYVWHRRSADSTDGTDLAARAEAARDALFAKLSGELKAAMAEGGAAAAIPVCAERATAIAAEVGAEHGVDIGRTSLRLRRPTNTAPAWAVGHVNEDRPEAFSARSEDGGLRALFPIRIAPLCLDCHGDPEELAPDVRNALAASYPLDQATSYSAGDLRGWFWVEVPPGP